MANVQFCYGTKAEIDATAYTEGAMYLNVDDKTLLIDMNNKRYVIGEIPELGVASAYGVDNTIPAEAASSDNLPTTKAVKDYVDAFVGPEIVYSDTQPTDANVKI